MVPGLRKLNWMSTFHILFNANFIYHSWALGAAKMQRMKL